MRKQGSSYNLQSCLLHYFFSSFYRKTYSMLALTGTIQESRLRDFMDWIGIMHCPAGYCMNQIWFLLLPSNFSRTLQNGTSPERKSLQTHILLPKHRIMPIPRRTFQNVPLFPNVHIPEVPRRNFQNVLLFKYFIVHSLVVITASTAHRWF